MADLTMVSNTGDQLIVVFEGAYQDATFLFTLLTGSGIEAHIDSRIGGDGPAGLPAARLLVRKADWDLVLPLVEDFKQNGKRADP
jgi:hypothetical protein